MSRLLVDTSVWIEYFRSGRGPAFDLLDEELEQGEVAVCGPVVAELLRGLRGKKEEGIIADIFQALPYIEVDREDWEGAARMLGAGSPKGHRVPLTDGLIARLCLRHGLRLLTFDRHFDLFDRIERVRPR